MLFNFDRLGEQAGYQTSSSVSLVLKREFEVVSDFWTPIGSKACTYHNTSDNRPAKGFCILFGFFDWIDKPWITRRKELLSSAVAYWFENYPIGYTDVAKRFGIRPGTLYGSIKRTVAKLPEQLRPKRIHFWDVQRKTAPGKFRMAVEKLSDIPADRPLTTAERKALFEELKDAKARLVCAESLLEVAVESCKDDLKKKELQRQLELTRKALKSLGSVG